MRVPAQKIRISGDKIRRSAFLFQRPVRGGQHLFDGGANNAAAFAPLPDNVSEFKNFIALNYRDADGEPMAGVGYKIKFADGATIKGKLDQAGNARHENVPNKPTFAEYDEREPLPEKPWAPLSELVAKARQIFST